MKFRGIYDVKRNRLDNQVDMGCEMGEDPRMSPSLGCGKVASICSMKLSEASFVSL